MSGARIGAQGASYTWTSQKKNVVRIFGLFIEQDEELSTGASTSWEELSEETLCGPDVYERFGYYMLNVYEPDQRKGEEHLDGSTVRNYLGIAVHLACDKFKAVGSDTTKRFFDCLDTNSTSEHAKWLRGVKANIERAHCERQDAAGKKIDKSESARAPSQFDTLPATLSHPPISLRACSKSLHRCSPSPLSHPPIFLRVCSRSLHRCSHCSRIRAECFQVFITTGM